MTSQKCVKSPLIHRLRNCREISELDGIFLGYQIPKQMVGFGAQTNILTPPSLYASSPSSGIATVFYEKAPC